MMFSQQRPLSHTFNLHLFKKNIVNHYVVFYHSESPHQVLSENNETSVSN